MHAFLVSSLQHLASTDTLEIYPDTSIGIDEIRAIQHFLSRKPIGDKNIIVIHDAHKLTLPAQQAILKTLEEPPGNSLIYLISSHPYLLLPTILSRVQIIIDSQPVIPSTMDHKLITKLLESGIGDRLQILDSQNFTRETFLEFLNSIEIYIHNSTLNANLYTLITDTRRHLKANCNLKLVLTHLAINLP